MKLIHESLVVIFSFATILGAGRTAGKNVVVPCAGSKKDVWCGRLNVPKSNKGGAAIFLLQKPFKLKTKTKNRPETVLVCDSRDVFKQLCCPSTFKPVWVDEGNRDVDEMIWGFCVIMDGINEQRPVKGVKDAFTASPNEVNKACTPPSTTTVKKTN
ncbi:uncharacterized protein PGTG_20542 [Puccinia graminis f. sp. tritici CRL 75-36-700-3]|uniref:Uncharacterized protein n=1 Tax=Puccinia graminis f. sp. tritici (strain CRL 75-36-700-3 / race SCCL) TaxID=418459 RepID=E3NYD7_PUCGT|nr:uncharacterized protein PGTG_20542 [Puccinia graminis f. sp. tritici CRL 75-36-700-3]EFP94586.1 hypothetical protein PGTG_20542 [Puccinia graminis f. sp. tritici CRL 75-36-700-3]